MPALLTLVADASSRTAAPPSGGTSLPIILGVLALVLIGGWILWRVFSGRTRTLIAENLEDNPDTARFQREAGSGDLAHRARPEEPAERR